MMSPSLGRGDPDCVRAIDVAKAIMAAYVLGDDDGMQELVHPDAVLFFPGHRHEIPWAGLWRGTELARFLDVCKDALHFLEYRPIEFKEVDEETVVVTMWELVKARSTGIVRPNRHLALVTIRDGILIEWQEYADTAGQRSLFIEPPHPGAGSQAGPA